MSESTDCRQFAGENGHGMERQWCMRDGDGPRGHARTNIPARRHHETDSFTVRPSPGVGPGRIPISCWQGSAAVAAESDAAVDVGSRDLRLSDRLGLNLKR